MKNLDKFTLEVIIDSCLDMVHEIESGNSECDAHTMKVIAVFLYQLLKEAKSESA